MGRGLRRERPFVLAHHAGVCRRQKTIFFKENYMSKVTECYKQGLKDKALGNELLSLRKKFDSGKATKAQTVDAVIALAKKHGVTLAASDFDQKVSKIDDDALVAVAGGACAANAEACGGNATGASCSL
jgi:hypothetical protein